MNFDCCFEFGNRFGSLLLVNKLERAIVMGARIGWNICVERSDIDDTFNCLWIALVRPQENRQVAYAPTQEPQGCSRRLESPAVAVNGEGVLSITVEIACQLKLSLRVSKENVYATVVASERKTNFTFGTAAIG